jgi:hypothetical protein
VADDMAVMLAAALQQLQLGGSSSAADTIVTQGSNLNMTIDSKRTC